MPKLRLKRLIPKSIRKSKFRRLRRAASAGVALSELRLPHPLDEEVLLVVPLAALVGEARALQLELLEAEVRL